MSDGQGKSGKSGQNEMQCVVQMKAIVEMQTGFGSQSEKEQAQKKNRKYAKLAMLKISAKQGGSRDQKSDVHHCRIRTFAGQEATGQKRDEWKKDRHNQAMNGTQKRECHSYLIQFSPTACFHRTATYQRKAFLQVNCIIG